MITDRTHEAECLASRPTEGRTFRDPAPVRPWWQAYSEVLPWWLRLAKWLIA